MIVPVREYNADGSLKWTEQLVAEELRKAGVRLRLHKVTIRNQDLSRSPMEPMKERPAGMERFVQNAELEVLKEDEARAFAILETLDVQLSALHHPDRHQRREGSDPTELQDPPFSFHS